MTSNWDEPIFNKTNFYLYENPENGLIEYIPYDIDNTFGIDWLLFDRYKVLRGNQDLSHQSEIPFFLNGSSI